MYLSEEQMEALENAIEAMEISGGVVLANSEEYSRSVDVIISMLDSARKEKRRRALIRQFKNQIERGD